MSNPYTITIAGRFWQKTPESKKYFIADVDEITLFILAENVVSTTEGFFTSQVGIDEAKDRVKQRAEYLKRNQAQQPNVVSRSSNDPEILKALLEIKELLKTIALKITK